MTTQFEFVFYDLTTDATTANMKPGSVLQSIAEAVTEQIAGPFSDEWGIIQATIRLGTSPTDRAQGEIACNFRDAIPEAPGALAYHQVTNGIPDCEFGVDLFSSLTQGQESLSVGVSHELLELIKDAGANGWKEKQDGTGSMGAEEECDPVQNTSYNASNSVAVSNFVKASYWIPGAAGPWDYLGVLQSQEDTASGYEVRASAPTDVQQISGMHGFNLPRKETIKKFGMNVHNGRIISIRGELTELQRKRKSNPYSRTYRRGVRL